MTPAQEAEFLAEQPDTGRAEPRKRARPHHRPARQPSPMADDAPIDHGHPHAPGGGDFECSEEGKIYHSQRNVRLALTKLGTSLRYNLMSARSEIHGLPGFGPDLDDAAANNLRLTIDERFAFRLAKEFFWDFVENEARQHRYHPVREYLDGLRWDGIPRLDGWLTRYAGAADTPFTRAVGTIVLLAAVRRVRQPGCKFDEMLILESAEQGKGKSTALRILARDPNWFTDRFPMGESDQKMMEATSGRWIVEAGELHGMSKAGETWLKGYLSSSRDAARLPYARKNITVDRQFITIGTTNETDNYLTDGTGNRRFWPVRITEFDLQLLRAEIDQLWAEASVREAAGDSIRLDPTLYEAASKEQAERRQVSAIEQMIWNAIGEIEGKILVPNIYHLIGIVNVPSSSECRDIAKAMREMGWTRKQLRHDGRKQWFYSKGNESVLIDVALVGGRLTAQRTTMLNSPPATPAQRELIDPRHDVTAPHPAEVG